MTRVRDDHSLSRVELVVLARLSEPAPPTEAAIGKDVLQLALLSEPPAQAKQQIAQLLERLRERGLASEQRPPRARASRWALTAEGSRALQEQLGVKGGLSWKTIRGAHLPALALGLAPGSKQATETLRSGTSIAAAVLREKFKLSAGDTPTAVCDAMIAEELGLPPGEVTLAKIRAHVFARRAAIEAKGTPLEMTTRVAVAEVRATSSKREPMAQALGKRWLQQDVTSTLAESPPIPVPDPAPDLVTATAPRAVAPAPPLEGPALLAVVREAIARVGEEGRFGDEKVFVSALWHRLERDHRSAGISLDRFKRWLVTANRDGWLILANADLVGAMDPQLLADSEIADRGATFHFVLDRISSLPTTQRGNHVR